MRMGMGMASLARRTQTSLSSWDAIDIFGHEYHENNTIQEHHLRHIHRLISSTLKQVSFRLLPSLFCI